MQGKNNLVFLSHEVVDYLFRSIGCCVNGTLNTCIANREVAEYAVVDKLCNVNTCNIVEGCFSSGFFPVLILIVVK